MFTCFPPPLSCFPHQEFISQFPVTIFKTSQKVKEHTHETDRGGYNRNGKSLLVVFLCSEAGSHVVGLPMA